MDIKMNNIKTLRSVYPYSTIQVKTECLNEFYIRLTARIHTGCLPDGSAGTSLVDIDTIGSISDFETLKIKAMEEALIFAGFEPDSVSVQLGHSSIPETVPPLVDEKEKVKQGKELDGQGADELKAPRKARRKKTPNAKPLLSEPAGEKHPQAPEGKSDNPEDTSSDTPEDVAPANESMVPEGDLSDTAEPVEDTVTAEESACGDEITEGESEDVSEGAETCETEMSYEEASRVILVVKDATKAKAMKEFVGKPLFVINNSRPTLLRFLVRANEKGEGLVSEECAQAARILMAASR